MEYLINAIRGFCMALADSVPGVSGGTVAFILGFYDKFINSLDRLMFGKLSEKKEAILFLLKIGIGWIIGMAVAVLVLTNLFENRVYEISSLFMGFIIFSIPFIIKEEKSSLKVNKWYKNLIFTLIGVIIVCLITYLSPTSSSNVVNVLDIDISLCLYVFVAAMLAISAMVLPGISGSTILLIFGLYIPIITAVKEVLHFNFSYLPILIVFCLGVIAGVLLFIRLIKLALQKYRTQTMYLIIGLMIGSLYAIVMGPTTLDIPKEPMSFKTFSIIFFIIGGAIIFGLEKLKQVVNKKND